MTTLSDSQVIQISDLRHYQSAIVSDFANQSWWEQIQLKLSWISKVPVSMVVFYIATMIIAIVSVYDAWLVYLYRDSIASLERNLICLALIELEPEYASIFILSKLIGVGAVVFCLEMVRRFNSRIGFSAAMGVAAFQICLLCYLTLADFEIVLPKAWQVFA